jgi:CheY-like chemotaxis protein
MSGALRILVLNDDEDGLTLLRHTLSREFPDADILGYANPAEALKVFQMERIDAVVTDNRMPQMTGIDFVRHLRAAGMAIPVVMLTGSDEKKSEAIEAGVTTFISSGSWGDIRHEIRRTIESSPAPGRENLGIT